MDRGRIVLVLSLPGAAGTVPRCPASDYSLFFTISNEVSPDQPSTTVTMWAAFDPKWYAFGLSKPEVWSAGSGDFSSPQAIMKQKKYCDPGDVAPDGDSVTGTRLTQYQWLLGEFADTANPIELWSVAWTTDHFKPRSVPVWTRSSSFYIYVDASGQWDNFYGPDFSEARGTIQVVPAPAGSLVIGVGVFVSARRRR